MEYMLYVWIALTCIAVVMEAITTELVAIWFMPAGILAAILAANGVDLVWQIVAFLVLSCAGVALSRIFLKKFLKAKNTLTNIDAIIGENCIVTEKIDNYAGCGQAKVKGQVWSARAVDDNEIYEPGEMLNIVAIEGVKLICRKKQ